jgi:glycosyltransferase involved in cell wall biosynthesis
LGSGDRGRSVALYAPAWPPGLVHNGIVTYVGQISPVLARHGVRTHIVVPSDVSTPADPEVVDFTKLSFPIARQLLFRAIEKVPQLRQTGLHLGWEIAEAMAVVRDRHGLDLIEMEETLGAAWFVQDLFAAVPVVVRLHGPWFVNGTALGVPRDAEFRRREAIERLCITEAVGLTSPSADLLGRVRREYGLALAHAAVIPNSAPRIAPERRWTLEACDKKTVLFVGRFDRHKGGDVAIEAFAALAGKLPNVELAFVGPDRGFRDDAGRIHDISSFLEERLSPAIRARVLVRGALPAEQIEALRRQAFVTVVASRYENFSLALLEALSFGCPTIASATGGNGEILLAERTGLTFVAADASDLAAQMLALFENPQRAAELGHQAALDMEQRLSPDAVARATLDYYQTVWNAPPPRRSRGPRDLHRALYQLSGLV